MNNQYVPPVMTPLDRYQVLVNSARLEANPEQVSVLRYLTHVQARLLCRQKLGHRIVDCLTRRIRPSSPVQGLYLWGGVGIGKTMIMDCFYETLTVTKLRLHFHAFMQRLHQELRESQGQVNPLTAIGKRLSRQYKVICFDEFLVTNVADAMLLAELFKALFKGGVCLVTTANLPPEKLYEDGLQRQRFLPAIHLLQAHTRVWHLPLLHDYRRHGSPQRLTAYHSPLGEAAECSLQQLWEYFAATACFSQEPWHVHGREIQVKQRAGKVVWFEFNVICGRPRSQHDYLALAEQYAVVLVSNVPCLDKVSKDFVVSFINLVDILYDAGVRLVMSAAAPITQLYTRREFHHDFQRTESRLMEMQYRHECAL